MKCCYVAGEPDAWKWTRRTVIKGLVVDAPVDWALVEALPDPGGLYDGPSPFPIGDMRKLLRTLPKAHDEGPFVWPDRLPGLPQTHDDLLLEVGE